MDTETVKALKLMQEQINELRAQSEGYLLKLHNDNSVAIDNIVITMLGGSNESETK